MPRFSFFSTKADYEQLVKVHEFFSSLFFLRDSHFQSEELPFLRDFRDADLSGCVMRASVFEDCDFTGAILRGADLRRSLFRRCKFAKADLTGAIGDLEEMTVPRITATQKQSMIWHEEAGPEPPGG